MHLDRIVVSMKEPSYPPVAFPPPSSISISPREVIAVEDHSDNRALLSWIFPLITWMVCNQAELK
jgi:hypothetical protein